VSVPDPTDRRRIVVLLGMHRAGTSVTMNVLNALGVPLSDDLMPPTDFNAKGYFESLEISKVHDEILKLFGMLWSSSTITHPLPANWWRLPQVAPFKAQLVQIVGREFDKAGSLWGFKDPRTARLLPLWLEIIDELRLDPKYVLVTRHPTEVARSLHTREQVNPIHAELLWIEHNVDALVNTRGKLNAIVEYQRWFDDPLEQANYLIDRIGLKRRNDLNEILGEIVSKDLQHHAAKDKAFNLPFCAELYDALLQRDMAKLDGLTNFFQVTRSFTQTVTGLVQRELIGRVNAANAVAQEQAQRAAAFESQLRTLQASLAAPAAFPPGQTRIEPTGNT
jgi:hypothetical protein